MGQKGITFRERSGLVWRALGDGSFVIRLITVLLCVKRWSGVVRVPDVMFGKCSEMWDSALFCSVFVDRSVELLHFFGNVSPVSCNEACF